MKKLFSIIDEVEDHITKYPSLRDNDERLMANIWNKYLGDITFLNCKDILKMLSKSELPSYESISRCRRKIQELKPHLRGEKWVQRQSRANKIRKEIAI